MRNKVNFKENKKNPKKTKDAGVGGPPTPGWWTTDQTLVDLDMVGGPPTSGWWTTDQALVDLDMVGGPPTPGWWTTDHPPTSTAPKCAKFSEIAKFSEKLDFFDNKCPIKPQNHKNSINYLQKS